MDIQTYQQLSALVADQIIAKIKQKPDCCLGLPTGHTPIGTYKSLVEQSANGQVDWSRVRCFALDDYLEVDASFSFQSFLQNNLYDKVNASRQNLFNPTMVDNYDGLIAANGGLDLTILGIGANGHIAFNEPGTCLQSWTHCSFLTSSTKLANQDAFGSQEVPDRGITMGIKTIMESRSITLIASGEKKRGIVESAFRGPITNEVPASLLQEHKTLSVITDFGFMLSTAN